MLQSRLGPGVDRTKFMHDLAFLNQGLVLLFGTAKDTILSLFTVIVIMAAIQSILSCIFQLS